jgi:hypothetical protein
VPWPLEVIGVAAEAAEGEWWDIGEPNVAQAFVRKEHVCAIGPHLLYLAPNRRRWPLGRRLGLFGNLLPTVAYEVGALERIRLRAALDELLTHVDAGPGDPALVVCIRDFFRHATCDESIVE